MIDFEAVTKIFGDVTAVNQLNLKIAQGTLFGYLGPNGAGKTTTIKLLAGVIRPTSGMVRINGVDVHRSPIAAKRLFGYVPDNPYLYGKLTADELMAFVGGIYGLDRGTIAKKTDELFERFEIGEWRKSRAEGYSLGMKQKLLISAAFIHEPKVIVIDEPMAGLDPKSIRTLKDYLRESAAKGTTVFLSTHSLPVAEELCDKIGILHKGVLLVQGTVEELHDRVSGDGVSLESIFLEITDEDTQHNSTDSKSEVRESY